MLVLEAACATCVAWLSYGMLLLCLVVKPQVLLFSCNIHTSLDAEAVIADWYN